MEERTIAAIATPPGTGGIAIVRVSGPETYAMVSCIFRPKNTKKTLDKCAAYSAVFGTIHSGEKEIDQGIALCFRAPNSYTGEDTIEISCHGGGLVSGLVLEACFEAGAVPARPGEFTKKALLNGKMSLTQAEAVLDLIEARSRQGLSLAQGALHGALQRKIEEYKQSLIQLAAHLAAWTDYPEEDVEPIDVDAYLLNIEEIRARIAALLENYRQSHLLKRGISAALVGSTNVGKSTLFNLLAGRESAIVTELAGTTRDVIREEILIDGIPLFLSDTAGLRESAEPIEQEGIRRSNAEMERADLILAVFDGSESLDPAQLGWLQAHRQKPILAIVNKSDLGTVIDVETINSLSTKTILCSAHQEETRRNLQEAIKELLQWRPIEPEAVLLGNERQFNAALRAAEALQKAENEIREGVTLDVTSIYLEEAIECLAALTGESASEDIIEAVFAQYCVGK